MEKNKFITQEIPFILKKEVLFSGHTLQEIYIPVMKTMMDDGRAEKKEAARGLLFNSRLREQLAKLL